MKIPSAMLTNLELVKEISKLKTKTFISTGMSTLKDIDKVLELEKRHFGANAYGINLSLP